MARRYLNYEEVARTWDDLQAHWEDVYVTVGGAAAGRWMRDNPWDKPWNRPEWRSMTEGQRRQVLARLGLPAATDAKK